MNTKTIEIALPDLGPIGATVTSNLVRIWTDACNDFLDWQKREIIERRPSPEKVAEHKSGIRPLIILGHTLYGILADPGSPSHKHAAAVAGKLRQLEECMRMIHESMDDARADAVLAAAFPE